jgi:hypothetical protein
MLYAVGSGPKRVPRRVDLRPGTLGDATVRFQYEGWGLVQLHFGGFFRANELRWSHTNYNTEKRAAKWADVYPETVILQRGTGQRSTERQASSIEQFAP